MVELLVAALYLLATLIMRLSSEQRKYADFLVRSARAEPKPLLVYERSNSVAPERELLNIAQLVPLLTDSAFKLYMYLRTRTEPDTGCAHVGAETVAALGKPFNEVSSLLEELEQQGLCRQTDARPAAIGVQMFSPVEKTEVGVESTASSRKR